MNFAGIILTINTIFMKTRNAKKQKEEITNDAFENAVAMYAQAEKRELEINQIINIEVNELMSQFEGELKLLQQGKQNAFEIAQNYCVNNKSKLFSKRRSIGCTHGIAGFRLGTPRLRTAKGNSWNDVVVQLKEKLPEYIRTTEEPAKDLLLADRYKESVAPVLVELGIYIVQDELFYLEAKKAA